MKPKEYIEKFSEKQCITFEFWLDEEEGITSFMQGLYPVYINYKDIVYDIESNQPKGRILEWYNYVIDNFNYVEDIVSYFDYCKK